jgi:hypothetical protein
MTLEKFAIAVAFELKKHDIDVVLRERNFFCVNRRV